MTIKNLFDFTPSKTGESLILFFYRDGHYLDDKIFLIPDRFDKISILHNSKEKEDYRLDRFSVFREVIHWLRIYRMQNDRKAIIPNKIVVYECGKPMELQFNRKTFRVIVWILNKLPKKLLKYEQFKRFYGF